MVNKNIFNMDEKMVLNRVAGDLSKEEFLEQCDFSKMIAVDEDVDGLFDELKEKVASLSDEEWEALKKYLPFDVAVAEFDLDGRMEDGDETKEE